MHSVQTGADVLVEGRGPSLRGRRVALLVNQTAVTSRFEPLALALRRRGVDVRVLLAPEHGIWGTAQDMEPVADQLDPLTGLPVVSLYGDTEASLSPARDVLADVDDLVYDIQDVGARYYTFAATLLRAMRVGTRAGVRVVVLDRPNPLGGVAVEGGSVDAALRSFVGEHPVCVRHGMTVGELARLFQREAVPDVELEVVAMRGWRRSMMWEDTGLAWVAPSPNMPSPTTALVYPGMCLLEGTTWSEGRGTTRPFELFGAPGVRADRLCDVLRGLDVAGATWRPTWFRPQFHKHAGTVCGGAQVHVTDARGLASWEAGLAVLWAALHGGAGGENFEWRQEAYEFVTDRLAIDLLLGDQALRQALEDGARPKELVELVEPQRQEFLARRREVLIYPAEEEG